MDSEYEEMIIELNTVTILIFWVGIFQLFNIFNIKVFVYEIIVLNNRSTYQPFQPTVKNIIKKTVHYEKAKSILTGVFKAKTIILKTIFTFLIIRRLEEVV